MKTRQLLISTIFILNSFFSFGQTELLDSPRGSSEFHIYKIDKEDLRKFKIISLNADREALG